jgi:hypothetical protein
MLLGTVAALLVASRLHKYPVGDRLLMFTVPLFTLWLACGASRLCSLLGRVHWTLVLLVLALLFVRPLGETYAKAAYPERNYGEHLRPLLQRLRQRIQPGDAICFYRTSLIVFRYYTDYRGFASLRDRTLIFNHTVYNQGGPLQPEVARSHLAAVSSAPRAWFVFSYQWIGPSTTDNDRAVLTQVLREHGQATVEFESPPNPKGLPACIIRYEPGAARAPGKASGSPSQKDQRPHGPSR